MIVTTTSGTAKWICNLLPTNSLHKTKRWWITEEEYLTIRKNTEETTEEVYRQRILILKRVYKNTERVYRQRILILKRILRKYTEEAREVY